MAKGQMRSTREKKKPKKDANAKKPAASNPARPFNFNTPPTGTK